MLSMHKSRIVYQKLLTMPKYARNMPCKQLCVPLEALDCLTLQIGKGHQLGLRPCGDKVHRRNSTAGSTNLSWRYKQWHCLVNLL
uniref:Putative UDP-3-O-3-hydroxymyristoyl N-acetylglucosamine deacetylase 2 isoform X3 n=1 Tax=Rhizophora mucronata TaxID=61149 RepID=A0A2P2K9K5_RHIMU